MTILLIIIFAVLIMTIGIMILINPQMVFAHMRANAKKARLHILAVSMRLVFGILLVYHAAASRYPLAIEILGWVSLLAAVLLAAIGVRNFNRFMLWALSFAKPYGRIAGALATGFGAFLIYAFI